MKTSLTVTFTGLFAAVAVCYYFFGMPISKTEAPLVTSGEARLLPFDPEKPLHLIQIQKLNEKETITLERSGEDWYLRHPANYLADKMMAEGLATALRASIKSRRLLREKGWEEYGLARPEIKIGVEAEGSSHRRYLLLGDKSQVADMIFARWEGETEYFLLDSRFKQAFDRSAYSLREKRVVRLGVEKVDKIHLQTFSGSYELSKQDGKWYWTEPVARIGKKIEGEQVYQLLLLLKELHIKDFLDGQSVEKKDLGFLHSAPYLQIWAQDKTSTLRLGKEIVDQDAYYARLEDEKTLLEVSKDVMTKFFKIFDGTGEAEAKSAVQADTKVPAAAVSPVPAASPVSLTKS